MHIETIAYKGEAYTIEWYFDDKGDSQPFKFYEGLNENDKIRVLRLFKRMGDSGDIKDKTKFMNEGNKIYAFKPQPDRFLCFFYEGRKVIVTNAFRKKQNKLPVNEKGKALRYRNDYIDRTNRGDYYE